jgi:hypothetical protein
MSVHRLVRFYLPSVKKYGSSFSIGEDALWQGLGIDCTVMSGVYQQAEQDSLSYGGQVPHVSMPPVSVAGNEEVEMLWFETIKLFSEFRPPTTSSECGLRLQLRALYTLEAVFLAGRTVKLPTCIWLKGLCEAMLRLPMGLSAVSLQQQPVGPVDTTPELALVLSLQSCVLVLDLLVADIADLRRSPEFPATYSRFVSLLAANAHYSWVLLHAGSGSGSGGSSGGLRPQLGAYADEVVLLIEAALRLLHIPSLAASEVVG